MSDGLVSQGAYLEVSVQSTGSYAFVAATDKITRASGDFTADGITVGMRLTTNAPVTANQGSFEVTAVSATEITTNGTLTDASAATTTITAFQKVGEVTSMNTPAGEPAEIDMSHLESTAREFRNGLRDEGSITGEMNFVPSDAGQTIMVEMQSEKTPRQVSITLPAVDDGAQQLDGYRWTFGGLVRGMPVSIGVDEKAVRAYTIRVSGSVTEEVIPV